MLEIKNLTKYYGNILGVKNLSLKINKGEVYGFIGPNGAGKSTTIRCVMHLLNKNTGSILIDNKEFLAHDINTTKRIGYLPSEINLYDDLTVEEIINYNNTFYEYDCLKKANKLLKRLDLDKKKKIEDLSLGNRKKLGIVLALMHNPELIIMDEASSGLDPLMQDEFFKILREEKKNGKTILYSTHNLSELKLICDRVGIIKNGEIIKEEIIEEMISNDMEIISIESSEIDKIKVDNIINKEKDMIKFMYHGDINKLLDKISKIKIKKILIEDPSIEEIFNHYYKG